MRIVRLVGLALLAVVALALVGVAILIATFDANRHKDTLIQVVREHTGRTLSIDGDIGLALFPRLAFSVEDVKLSGPDGKSEFAGIDALELAVEVLPLLRGELRIEQVRAERPVVRYARDQSGHSSFDGLGVPAGKGGEGKEQAETGDGGGRDLVFDLRELEVVDGTLIVRDAQAGRTGEVAGLSLSVGHLAPGRAAPWSFAGRFDFAQPAAQGTLDAGGKLALDGSAVAVRDLELKLDLVPPAGQSHGLRLAAGGEVEHDGGAGTTKLALAGTLDGTPFQVQAALQREAPIEFELKAAKLDVDRLLALVAARDSAPAAGKGGAKAGGDAPKADGQAVDLSFARGLRVNGKLRVEELRAAGLQLSEVNATIKGDGKALTIAPLSALGYGGRAEGSVRIDGVANGLAVRQKFSDLAVGELVRDLSGKDLLDGRGALNLDVTTRGATVGALKRALAGTAALSLRNGAVKGFDLARLLREGQALLSGGGEVGPVFNPADRTEVAELDATFRIAGGVARNDDLLARNQLLRLQGSGTIDIAKSRLDYTARATVADTAQAAQLDKLRGIDVPVQVSGPLEAPAARVVWSEVAGSVARKALSERLKESLGGGTGEKTPPATPEDAAKEELGRRLRDLLR